MRKRHLLLPCLLIVSALFLVACGGGSGDSDESEIEDAIETSATTNDPANCTEFSTQSFVEQSSGEIGKAALKACEVEAEDPNSNADSVAVTKVRVDGDTATAQAAIVGGTFDNQAVVLSVVKDDDQWKLDEIVEFAEFDQASLVAQYKKELEKGGELEPEVTACIAEGLEEAPQEEIEELVLSGDTAPIEELAEGCL